ncbi:hypothetical protein AOL_s00215g362 [Orbilia oligospora ATCC 24927]|uniref:Uncharacterized protein n=1 Tax=Arthrobotrys oligospora (strain ATCC 24927 / CBS 115.81 / DSM 1491) TaxID=756982 RepID=G1XU83_ARTOA|nr:hypothetical protein AOL_s00215g362 [Orbilia oligospora ATCC 24927]EGX43626.1 hypothetical protein AOL_s00215g362 [Orbilia oligospora ATCC 24927]
MAPCSSPQNLGSSRIDLVGTNSSIPNQNLPTQDPPRVPSTPIAPQPSEAPDNGPTPDSNGSADRGRSVETRPRPDGSQTGGLTWDNSH